MKAHLSAIDILNELQDKQALEAVRKARKIIKSGAKGIPVSNLFRKIRKRK